MANESTQEAAETSSSWLDVNELQLKPMASLIAYHAERKPDQLSLVFDEESVTWKELEERSNRVAHVLKHHGVEQNDFVTVALPNEVSTISVVLGIIKVGATPNMVSPKLPMVEIVQIIDLVEPKAIFSLDKALDCGRPILSPEIDCDKAISIAALPARVATYWRAMTSGGSTGRPKVIVDNEAAEYDPNVSLLDMPKDGVVFFPGPLYHAASFAFGMTALFAGNTLVVMNKFDPQVALEWIEKYRVQWTFLVPTMMQRIWKLGAEQRNRYDLSSLKSIWHAAAACPVWLKENWIEWLGPDCINELYSGTEDPGGTCISGREWLQYRGSVGRALPGATLKILDDQGEELPPGEVGEIYFEPDADRPESFHYIGAEAKTQGRAMTLGDLGYVNADGYLYIVDRRVDMIVSGGANIYPAEVEGAIDAHPSVLSSIVIGLPHEDLGHRVHAIVQIRESDKPAEVETLLREFLPQRIALNKTPRTYEFVYHSLRDDAGKARRSALRDERIKRGES